MTRDELILELKRSQAQCAAFSGDETDLQRRMDAASKAYGLAVELAERLAPQPAMAWQECVLDKLRASRDAYLRDDEYDTFERELIEDVMGEAIAVVRHSIPATPPLPERK